MFIVHHDEFLSQNNCSAAYPEPKRGPHTIYFETSEKSSLAKPPSRKESIFLIILRLCVSHTFGIIQKPHFISTIFLRLTVVSAFSWQMYTPLAKFPASK